MMPPAKTATVWLAGQKADAEQRTVIPRRRIVPHEPGSVSQPVAQSAQSARRLGGALGCAAPLVELGTTWHATVMSQLKPLPRANDPVRCSATPYVTPRMRTLGPPPHAVCGRARSALYYCACRMGPGLSRTRPRALGLHRHDDQVPLRLRNAHAQLGISGETPQCNKPSTENELNACASCIFAWRFSCVSASSQGYEGRG
jgi:hypothetical protein